jgi:hypothetical protein
MQCQQQQLRHTLKVHQVVSSHIFNSSTDVSD